MRFDYKPKGTCSSRIEFEIEDGLLKEVQYFGGCNGNLQGVSRLVEGMDVDAVIEKLRGIRCGMKPTSCPDQLSLALTEAKKAMQERA